MQPSSLVVYYDDEKTASSAVQEIIAKREVKLVKSGSYSRYGQMVKKQHERCLPTRQLVASLKSFASKSISVLGNNHCV